MVNGLTFFRIFSVLLLKLKNPPLPPLLPAENSWHYVHLLFAHFYCCSSFLSFMLCTVEITISYFKVNYNVYGTVRIL